MPQPTVMVKTYFHSSFQSHWHWQRKLGCMLPSCDKFSSVCTLVLIFRWLCCSRPALLVLFALWYCWENVLWSTCRPSLSSLRIFVSSTLGEDQVWTGNWSSWQKLVTAWLEIMVVWRRKLRWVILVSRISCLIWELLLIVWNIFCESYLL